VSQRSRTLEQVERGRCEQLLQLVASLVSDVRFCARNHGVWELVKDLVERQGAAMTEEVEGRVATAYNDNAMYRDTMLKLIDGSEEGRNAVAELVREEGVRRRDGGDREGALGHLSKAIAVTEELCANDKPRMDRLAGLREEVAGMHGESGVGAAEAKTALAENLRGQGEYEKASELLTEALGIYQSELSEEVRGASFAGAWVWGID
jgi:tetratricopeptide (TPR) repeat protein